MEYEDEEDYGDVDIGCSSISIPRQEENVPDIAPEEDSKEDIN